MKRLMLLTVIIGLLMSSGAIAQDSWKNWSEISPKKFDKKSTIKVSDNERLYYVASQKEEVILEISGPARIRILSRLELPNQESKNDFGYEISYTKDGKKKSKRIKTEKSKEAFNEVRKNVGQSRSFYLTVPKGKHKYVFSALKDQVYLRFFRKNTSWVHYTPKGKNEIVILESKEQELPYTRLKSNGQISIDLIGSARLKVLARLEYTAKMSGERSYRLQVSENGKVINTYNLTTYKSETTTYKKKSDLIPAKGEKFYFDVPKGKHQYDFKLLDSDSSVLLRFFIPEKHVNNSSK